ncbi:hypothetical protein AAG570_013578 [Ranatra chinensis]|uniref:Uncharacterized protein n=1 Tax=Ranatra chinensis TaxID=642074 RepID=A0ABD0YCL1_9HEMI
MQFLILRRLGSSPRVQLPVRTPWDRRAIAVMAFQVATVLPILYHFFWDSEKSSFLTDELYFLCCAIVVIHLSAQLFRISSAVANLRRQLSDSSTSYKKSICFAFCAYRAQASFKRHNVQLP